MPLIHFWVVEDHYPERVLRQFGMKQGIPVDVNTSTELHKITLQGKQHQNWAQVHALHIAKWVAHAEIADVPPFHREMSYNDEYVDHIEDVVVKENKETCPSPDPTPEWFTQNTWDNMFDPLPVMQAEVLPWTPGEQPIKGMVFATKLVVRRALT